MIVRAKNGLKGTFSAYQKKCIISKLIKDIPIARRKKLAEEIQIKANFFGCKNKEVLEAVLKKLEGGKRTKEVEA